MIRRLLRAVERLLLPPTSPLLMLLGALWLRRRGRARTATGLTLAAIGLLYLASLPVLSQALLSGQQTVPALAPEALGRHRAGAIVVLGGGVDPSPPEFPAPVLSRYSLVRLRYALFVQRRTGLPLLVTGAGGPEGASEAALMAAAARREGVEVRWVDGQAVSTRENARHAARLLAPHEIRRVYVVTHAWHMPRAMQSFRAAGLDPIGAPTEFFRPDPRGGLSDWVPSAEALATTRRALHERLGQLYYAVRD